MQSQKAYYSTDENINLSNHAKLSHIFQDSVTQPQFLFCNLFEYNLLVIHNLNFWPQNF